MIHPGLLLQILALLLIVTATSLVKAGSDAGVSGARCSQVPDLRVRLIGRYDGCETSGVRMSWSGTGFAASFQGTGLSITQAGPALQYTTIVDGVPRLLETRAGSHEYVIADKLPAAEHSVAVYRRGEAFLGTAVLQRVDVTGGRLLAPPPPATRLIEVIGDSISAGYGNEGADAYCSFSADTENHYLTYASVLARRFDADLSTIAWSGKGVVSNYGGDRSVPMPALFSLANPNDPAGEWHFQRQPQLVVINLGTNDYSADTDPADDEFISAYQGLLGMIRHHYPDTYILATVGPMLSGADLATARRNITRAVRRRQDAGDARLEAFELTTPNDEPGCDWHPNLETHAAMAAELAVPIAAALQW